ncbi:hypothetical protein [Methylocella tundrae]|uniref:hypothetical protein n=1 Tax=Methylocella tundrae TaxID=227605 RepID=UPI00157B14DC|nr:hypothetical protein [Methylocella tundrae]
MNRQYRAPSRRQGGDNPYGVGVISVGSTYYLQEDHYWRDRFRGRPLLRNPWIVEAFLNGIMGAARRNSTTGKWESRFISGRSDMAIVRSLREGRRKTIAVRILILHDDHDLYSEPTTYPSLPTPRCRPKAITSEPPTRTRSPQPALPLTATL